MRSLVVSLALLASASTARADVDNAPPNGDGADGDAPPRTWFNLRGGASTSNATPRPEICGEVAPHRKLSLQACGTGAGLWHDDPAPQTMHVRADWHVTSFHLGGVYFEPLVGVGLAEQQVGHDDPGLKLTSTGPRNVETAGPEAATSLRAIKPIGAGFALVGDLAVGVAYLPHAPSLVIPQKTVQPFAGIGFGLAF